MDIYLMQNGTRNGPLRIFQVKELLDRGEIGVGDLGWHPGLPEWRPLSEIDALTAYLPRTTPPPLPVVESASDRPVPDQPVAMTRWELFARRALPRFLARVFDAALWFFIVSAIAIATGLMPPGEFAFPRFAFLLGQGLLWVLTEAWLLSRFGTTPGKWIFNLRVEHLDGGPPDSRRALKRAFFIWVCAWGLGFPGWACFGSLVALVLYLQNGRMVWDFLVRTDVVHGPARPARWVLFGGMLVVYTMLKMVVMFTQPLPDNIDPEARRKFEEARERLRSSFRSAPDTAR